MDESASSRDLLEPQQMIVELLLQPPFLIQHEGGERLIVRSYGLLASVESPIYKSFFVHIGSVNHSRSIPNNPIFDHVIIFAIILSGE